MEIRIKRFQELTPDEVYALLQLRSEIFVVEQECIYLDPDGKDHKALHVLGMESGKLVAYTRLFAPGDYMEQASIGRVAVRMENRGKGLARQIMIASMDAIGQHYHTAHIALSAQRYLEDFYRDLGFEATGEPYLEDGIPHIEMHRVP